MKKRPISSKPKNKKHSAQKKGKPHSGGKPSPGTGSGRSSQQPRLSHRPNLYGMHAVREAWLNPQRRFEALYLTPNAASGFDDILKNAQASGLKRPEPVSVEGQVLDQELGGGVVHQGIAAFAHPLEEVFLQDVLIETDQRDHLSRLVILDQVTDPHNVGAIIRSACAFGMDAVIMQSKHAPELNGVVAKTACGGIEHVDVVYETNLSRSIEKLQEAGFFVLGLDERGEKLIGDPSLSALSKVCVVMGAEGPGLRRLVKEKCDELVKLPTSGQLSSLNVSNAAAVSFYALSGEG